MLSRRGASDVFYAYAFENIHRKREASDNFRKGTHNLKLSILDRQGEPVREFILRGPRVHGEKHFVYSQGYEYKPWNLVLRNNSNDNCYVVTTKSDFAILVELDPETIRSAAKTTVELAR